MDCCTQGFPVRHQLPELAQTHVHQDGDAIQPSHPLSSPSPPAFNISQHQGLVQWVSSCIRWPILRYAAAKSLQSFPTLCDPVDGSPPGSPIPGILQARTLEWVAISFSIDCAKGDRMGTYICTAESLSCSPETITTLLVGCILIQNKKFKRKKKK